MIRVGLTGGLACGKSTVAAILKEKGCGLVNADHLGHEVIARGGPAYDGVVAEFGRDILDANGNIDRKRLAARVFGNEVRVQRLNELVHPHIRRRIDEEARAFAARQPDGIFVIEAALLLESFGESRVDKVVVVDCAEEQQVQRFTERGGSAEDARRRIAAQLPRAERLRRAHFVVDASGTLDDTRRQVDDLFARLTAAVATEGKRV